MVSLLILEGLLNLIDTLNPENDSGRLTLIVHFCHDHAENRLHKLIRTVDCEKHKIMRSYDSMRGNMVTIDGYKTLLFDHALGEVEFFFNTL